VAADEIELQLSGLVGRDAHVGQLPETGIDAVYRLTPRRSGFNRLAGSLYGGECLGIDGNRSIVPCHSDNVGDRKGMAVQRDRSCHGNQS